MLLRDLVEQMASGKDPTIAQNNPEQRIAPSSLEQDPKQVLLLNKTKVNKLVVFKYKPSTMFENSVATVVKICPSVLLPHMISQILGVFNKPEMIVLTDDEYFTFLTPDGELYYKSVLPDSDATPTSKQTI